MYGCVILNKTCVIERISYNKEFLLYIKYEQWINRIKWNNIKKMKIMLIMINLWNNSLIITQNYTYNVPLSTPSSLTMPILLNNQNANTHSGCLAVNTAKSKASNFRVSPNLRMYLSDLLTSRPGMENEHGRIHSYSSSISTSTPDYIEFIIFIK